MVEVMDQTLHFLNRQAMVRIYSPYSDVPRHVSAHFHLVDFVVYFVTLHSLLIGVMSSNIFTIVFDCWSDMMCFVSNSLILRGRGDIVLLI